jgi:hypothetical protein
MTRRLVLVAALALVALTVPGDALGGGAAGGGTGLFGVFFTDSGRIVRQTTTPVEVQGRVEVEFHGDTAAGCDALGTCDTTGRIAWEPGHSASLALVDIQLNGRRSTQTQGTLFFQSASDQDSTIVAKVLRGTGGAPKACADARRSSLAPSLDPAGRGRLRVDLAGPGREDLLATRCGGPLWGDVGLAIAPISLAVVRRGRATVGLAAQRSFAGHGFAGTVSSSLVLRLGRPHSATSHAPPPDAFPQHSVRMLTASYRIERVTGRVRVGFQGESELARCEPLDACGLTGTVDLVTSARSGTAYLSAFGSGSLPRSRFRAALGLTAGSARGVTVSGGGDWSGPGSAVQAQTWQVGGFCRSETPVLSGALQIQTAGGTARVDFGGGSVEPGAPHGRCPGPLPAEVPILVSGSVGLRALAGRRVVLHLRQGHRFSGEAHAGSTSGDVTIVLRRLTLRENNYLGL